MLFFVIILQIRRQIQSVAGLLCLYSYTRTYQFVYTAVKRMRRGDLMPTQQIRRDEEEMKVIHGRPVSLKLLSRIPSIAPLSGLRSF